jgi:hypothetical protein
MGVPYQGVNMTSHLQYVTVRNEVGEGNRGLGLGQGGRGWGRRHVQ